MNATCSIYTLSNPVTGEVRYVGKTIHGAKRLLGHLRDDSNNHKVAWIKSLKALGLKPLFEILEEVEESAWIEAEQFWIKSLKFLGCRLTNSVEGGIGGHNPCAETRKKIGDANRDRVVSEETRALLSAAAKGKIISEAHRAISSATHKGKIIPQYHRDAISKANTGLVRTPEHKAKISASSKARMSIQENRDRISKANKGLKRSPECRMKIKLSWQNPARRLAMKKKFPPHRGTGCPCLI